MQIKIGQIYKVKPKFRKGCGVFKSIGGVYIRYLNNNTTYEILDKSKNCLSSCSYCFKPEHLEPIEKTLYNLEIGDLVENLILKQKVIGLVESDPENPLYVLDGGNYIYSAKELEEKGYKVVQTESTEEIKEMTVEEISKLIGKKVKIVE